MDLNFSKDTFALDDLPLRSADARSRRNTLFDERQSLVKAEASHRQRLLSFSIENHQNLPLKHPLSENFKQTLSGVVMALSNAQQVMLAKHQEVIAARERQMGIKQEIDGLEAKYASFRKWGWILLILVVGYFILKKSAAIRRELDSLYNQVKLEDALIQQATTEIDLKREAATSAFDELCAQSRERYRTLMRDDAGAWQQERDQIPAMLKGDWDESSWQNHDFSVTSRPPFLVGGFATESEPGGVLWPCFIPFIGKSRTVVIGGPSEEKSLSLMHSLVMQVATLLPHGATFTLLDPSGAGRAFPMENNLPFVRQSEGLDLFRDLDPVRAQIRHVIQTCLDDKTLSFEQLPDTTQANRRYEFIFAANFPEGYDRRAIESLQAVAKNGPIAGKYLFIHRSPNGELPRDMSWDDFGDIWSCDLSSPPSEWRPERCAFAPLEGPRGGAMSQILDLLKTAKPPETKVSWEDLSPDPADWWAEDATQMVSAPVGSSGRDSKLTLWFGANAGGNACSHGMVAGTTGSGKSILYHALISGLAMRYSPQQLELYLIDLKEGTEFQFYRSLPHARVVALNSDPELSRSVLREFKAEMDRRNDLFKQHGLSSYSDYREKGSPGGIVPRCLLLIDEYQRLFEDDKDNQASALLGQLAQQGRSAGLHLLLGSQRFGAAGMLNQTSIFGNMHLRIALQMATADIHGLTEFGRKGRSLIEECDQAGKAVVNDKVGAEEANTSGKIAYVDKGKHLGPLLAALAEKAKNDLPPDKRFATVVFDGTQQPNLCENPQMLDIVRLPQRPEPESWRAIATAPEHRGGLSVVDWFGGERPLALWIGQDLTVHGQARIILRRRQGENILMVGDNQMAITGMLIAMLASIPVFEPASSIRIWCLDRSVPGTPWNGMLESTAADLLRPLGYGCETETEASNLTDWLTLWSAELKKRQALDETRMAGQPTWLMVVSGVDRVNSLTRTSTRYGTLEESTGTDLLKKILREGPVAGMHVILSFPTATSVKQIFERGQLELFKHRTATQMGDADSFLIFDGDGASRLQREPRPVFALNRDTSSGRNTRFKPYTVDAEIAWQDQFLRLSNHLAAWKTNSNLS